MRRIKLSEGGVAHPVTGKIVFPEPPAAGTLEPSLINSWQEEIAGAIEVSGMTLDETSTGQLSTALRLPHRVTGTLALTVNAANPASATSFQTLQAALDSLIGRYLDAAASVVITIQDVSLTLVAPITVSLPQGNQVIVKSAFVGPLSFGHTSITFNYLASNGDSYFRLKKGCSIKFENINFYGRPDDSINSASLFRVGQGSSVHLTNCRIIDIVGNALIAEDGGYIEYKTGAFTNHRAPTGPDVEGDHGHACVARRGGVAVLEGVTAYYPTLYASLKSAFMAETKGHISLTSCGTEYAFIESRYGGSIRAIATTSLPDGANTTAFACRYNSTMNLTSCVAGRTGGGALTPRIGYLCDFSSMIYGLSCTAPKTSEAGFYAYSNATMYLKDSVVAGGGNFGYFAAGGAQIYMHSQVGATTGSFVAAPYVPAVGQEGSGGSFVTLFTGY